MKLRYTYLALIFSFLLGSHNGFVALWKSGSSQPLKVFPYSIQSLPPADQLKLQQGIPISSREQLQMILQDYLS